METLPNWARLWAELSQLQDGAFARQRQNPKDDFWKDRAKNFNKMVNKRWEKPDSSREFLLARLKANPGSTLLDIGAGTGKWAVFAAPHAKSVTAMEPSIPMREILEENIREKDIQNIRIHTGRWPDDEVEPHDYVLASHSMYGEEDLRGFVQKMNLIAQRGCIMVLRAPYAQSVMGLAARHVLGHPYDSPNFQVALNVLHTMDIYPDVHMEAEVIWQAWKHSSLEEALEDIKNRLNIHDRTDHDTWLMELLEQELTYDGESYVWPPGNRAALVYWEVNP
ncbi:MAG: class I SAM-dependent methyltransferase [Desulfobacterales bacterium]|nr:class I SAM-dependent methyltransferase [Desulfobacterales bacterium]